MAAVAIPRTVPEPIRIPVRELMPWAIFAGVLLLFLLYVVGGEQGAVSFVGGSQIHEFVHDARHLLGFPCH
jgi:hypothetical protein